jgi:hypothetical protein
MMKDERACCAVAVVVASQSKSAVEPRFIRSNVPDDTCSASAELSSMKQTRLFIVIVVAPLGN